MGVLGLIQPRRLSPTNVGGMSVGVDGERLLIDVSIYMQMRVRKSMPGDWDLIQNTRSTIVTVISRLG